jgi:hypothetical protein
MPKALEKELSRRAKLLAKRDGHIHELYDGMSTAHVLVMGELVIYLFDTGQLNVQTNVQPSKMLYGESVSGLAVETSPDDVLQGAVDYLKRYMILDDLADA